jgi:hypothetical protein
MNARHKRAAATANFLVLGLFVGVAAFIRADDKPSDNPVAVQFREHLAAADKNKDGIVTREELLAEVSKAKPDRETVEQVVSAMMSELDTDHDDKLSATEIAEGVRKTGEKAIRKEDVRRAQQIVDALAQYKQRHDGAQPETLEDLARLKFVPAGALRCILAGGEEKPWGFERAYDPRTVTIFSPGPINSERQYIVGLADGQVLGVQDSDLQIDKYARHHMHIYTAKQHDDE